MKWQGILSYSPSSKGPVIIEVGGWGGGGGGVGGVEIGGPSIFWDGIWGALKCQKMILGEGGGALQVSFK